MGRLRCLLGLGIALAAAGCQVKAPTSNAVQYPSYIRFPENEVATGVSVFRNSMNKGGMVEVARVSRTCLGTTAPGVERGLVRQCFAFETAAFQVATAHDARMGSAPLANLSRRDFDRRLDGYCAAMGITPPDCPAARTSMTEQVASRLSR